MNLAPPASTTGTATAHPLVAQLATRHGFTELSVEAFDAWADAPGRALVVFTEDPVRYKETLDLAVIAPEPSGSQKQSEHSSKPTAASSITRASLALTPVGSIGSAH